jgi:hypothetical protein
MTDKPDNPPGSEVARLQGCLCPVIDNHYGAGRPSKNGPLFWINGRCPVHARRQEKPDGR